MSESRPHLIILAGPNGAGKSTAAAALLKGILNVDEFVNADVLAMGLSAFAPEKAALEAGKIMLRRLKALAARREDFAFETTLASRMVAPWIADLRKAGYRMSLVFLFLQSADQAVSRVAERVRGGGHNVPEETIRRRYAAGLQNFFRLYVPLANEWFLYDNSKRSGPRLIATGNANGAVKITDSQNWKELQVAYGS